MPGTQKAWAAFIIGLLLVIAQTIQGLVDDGWDSSDTLVLAITVLGWLGTTLGVYQVTNTPPKE